MTVTARPLVAGNWKMNGLRASLPEALSLVERLASGPAPACEIMICPPATLVSRLAEKVSGTPVRIGGQDCHADATGAHTGDVSAEMLADAGASAVIVGHSERRTDHGETDEQVNAKARAAWRAGLVAILCIGETEAERRGGKTLDVLSSQIAGSVPSGATAANSVIAYEPVWAIGSGLTPSVKDVAEAHAHIRAKLGAALGKKEAEAMRILYGGSVKPGNAAELMGIANVNGALVGGASLKATDFDGIINAYRR
ncbi:MAG: triose-phosphate isomerase [Pseudomonadota bacterium]|nr:triose-phosphate isomerase [Pseudomonadota bacterium]